jgi:hypothetical protein
MAITVSVEQVLNAQFAIREMSEKSQNDKNFPFDVTYWLVKVAKEVEEKMKIPSEQLQKLNQDFGITAENATTSLDDLLGDKKADFLAKRKVIFEDKIKLDVSHMNVKKLDGTGVGAYTLMSVLPFLNE